MNEHGRYGLEKNNKESLNYYNKSLENLKNTLSKKKTEDKHRGARNRLLSSGSLDEELMEKDKEGKYKIQIFSNPSAEESLKESVFNDLLGEFKGISAFDALLDNKEIESISNLQKSITNINSQEFKSCRNLVLSYYTEDYKEHLSDSNISAGINLVLRRAILEQKALSTPQKDETKESNKWMKRVRDPEEGENKKRQRSNSI